MDYISFPKLGITLNISPGFSIGNFEIRWYGVIICIGIILNIFLGTRFCKKYGLDAEKILDYVLVAVPSSIIGARIYYVIFSWDSYKDDIKKVFAIWEGGLAIYGAIIAVMIAVFIMAKIRKDSFIHLIDFAMPYIILGQAIGRWGNFTNQEAYGGATSSLFGMTGSIIGSTPVQPTFLYESVWCFIAFFVLVIYRYRFQKNFGEVTALYMILYGLERTFVELLRTDSLMIKLGSTSLRVSHCLSAVLLIVGIAFFIDSRLKGKSVAEKIGSPWPIRKEDAGEGDTSSLAGIAEELSANAAADDETQSDASDEQPSDDASAEETAEEPAADTGDNAAEENNA